MTHKLSSTQLGNDSSEKRYKKSTKCTRRIRCVDYFGHFNFLLFIYLIIYFICLTPFFFEERQVLQKHAVHTFGIRQTYVVHTLLISHERYANAGHTLLYAVISHDTPWIRYE